MGIKEEFFSFLAKIFYRTKFNFKVNFNDFEPKREDAYILVGNHPCLHDGVYTSTYLKNPPAPVINTFMFTSKIWKYILTKLYPSIPKRKGQSDIITVRMMMKVIKNGRGVMLFPEGNSSYYGKESKIPYSTVKFMKKMKKDIVFCKTNGAYLSMPRWGSKQTRKGLIELNFYTLFKGKDLETLSLEEIETKINEAIEYNDFDWNRERKYIYKPKKRALGLERFIYICPKCKSHQTISTKGNKIYCSKCGEIAEFNKYSLLDGLPFDNLVEWGELQKKEWETLSKKTLYTSGIMFDVDMEKYTSEKIGIVDIKLFEEVLYVQHLLKEYSFDLEKIKGLTLTKKDEVSFDYEEKTYFIKMKDPMLFYDMIKYKIGG
ncbi:hypothetical protein RJI07_04340 [Mycoplasmatota bacterium WC30]